MNIRFKQSGVNICQYEKRKCQCGNCNHDLALIIEFEENGKDFEKGKLMWCPTDDELKVLKQAFKSVSAHNLENNLFCYKVLKKEC